LKRRRFSPDLISRIKTAYKLIIRSGLRLDEALHRVRSEVAMSPEIEHLIAFAEKSERGICR